MTPESGGDERGMILLNVLVIVAVAAAVVVVMLSTEDEAVERSLRLRNAAAASAIARGGELSAVTALRRDAEESPGSDHLREPWATVDQSDTPIEGGRFSLTVSDAQARFNVNSIVLGGGVTAVGAFRNLCLAGRVTPADCERLILHVQAVGPLDEAADLVAADADPAAFARLAPFITALPRRTGVNLNTADEPLLAALLGNVGAARQIVSRRSGKGFVDSGDLAAARILAPPGLGFSSDVFWVDSTVTIDGVTQRWRSLLERRTTGQGVTVEALARKRIPAAPLRAPPVREGR